MANGIYGLSKENYSFPGILADDIKVVLTRTYAPNFATDEFLADILLADRVATSANLVNKTFALGVFAADPFAFTLVPAGAACDFLIIYWDDGGVEATSRLLCGLDTGFTGLPVTPTGADINVTWAAGGIFGL
jgi:hypothetical protein